MGYGLSAVGREVLLHAALLLAVLAATLAGYTSTQPATVRAADDLNAAFYSMHGAEQVDGLPPFRWTDGSSSVCVAQFGYARYVAVHLTLLGQYAAPLGVDEVRLHAPGLSPVAAPLPPTTRHYHLLAAPPPAASDLCLTITSDTAQSPGDPRVLGVQFHALEASRLTQAGPVLPAPGQAALNVLAALLAFWALRALGLPAALAASSLALLALLLGVGLGLELLEAGPEIGRRVLLLAGGMALLLAGGFAMRGFARWPERPGWLRHRLTSDLLAMVFWSVALVGAVYALQLAYGRHGVWPLKAGVWPGFTPLVGVAVALCALWLAGLLLLLRREQPPLLPSIGLLLAGAVALPVVLKVSVRGWQRLYMTFRDNPSDYIHDVPLVGADPLGFLGRYVELSPTLAWHNSNHPPGSVLLLWGVEQVLGPGAVPASWVAIVLSSLVVVAAFWLGLRLGGRHLALLAGALMVVMPGHQVYSVTSMDGVFNGLLALAAVAFFLALEPGARPWRAVLAGVLLALGLFFTYATTQLFFFGAAVCLLALQRGAPLGHVLRQGMLAAGTLVLLYGVLAAATGFNIIEAVLQAKANNARLLGDPTATDPGLMGLPSVSHYTYYLGVNIVPFLWYLAPWGLAALTPRIVAGWRARRQPGSLDVLALALLALVLGMWLSGPFVREVERIWGFAYPLAAVLMAAHVWQGERQHERLWRAGLWVALFFAQAATMHMLLNTYW
jgi:hypothetical protein